MPDRRILSLWFPRLGAERILRAEPGLALQGGAPFATVHEEANAQRLAALSQTGEAAGLSIGQGLRDALVLCPALVTRPADPVGEARFLVMLRRWAGRYSPWVGEAGPQGLSLDITGCAHLFGGEEAMVAQMGESAARMGLSLRAGLADTLGAAHALAHFAAREGTPQIAPPGQLRRALSPLPVAALRIPEATATQLARLGLGRIGDVMGTPRATLGRRFGKELALRLDQALGLSAEPVSPARAPDHFATRLSLPEPIGLEGDILAAIERLLDPLCAKLKARGRGARRVRLECFRVDQASVGAEVALARAAADPDRLRPLLAMKLGEIDAGFGIDAIRIEASLTEPLTPRQQRSRILEPGGAKSAPPGGSGLDDLIGRMGARVGLEAITRLHPADSHIPEKAHKIMAAAWSDPARGWRAAGGTRPLTLWPPEPIGAPEDPALPLRFRWRRRAMQVHGASGPERIAPEWWLDDPEWRSGLRDYWRVRCKGGEALWLFYAHGGALSAGWFCHGQFA